MAKERLPHILGESLRRAANIDLTMVSYRGGEQARADLLGGRVDINIAPTANLLPLIQDGKARPIAFTGAARSPDLPDVPTTAESGFPAVGYNPDVWLGLFAPGGTPAAIVNQLNAADDGDAQIAGDESRAGQARLWRDDGDAAEFSAFLAERNEKMAAASRQCRHQGGLS